jgi:hypothetical protein
MKNRHRLHPSKTIPTQRRRQAAAERLKATLDIAAAGGFRLKPSAFFPDGLKWGPEETTRMEAELATLVVRGASV